MPEIDLCIVTGTLRKKVGGEPLPNGVLYVVRVVKPGHIIQVGPSTGVPADEDGVVTVSLQRASTAYLYADAVGLDASRAVGTAVSIPNTPTAVLEELLDIALPPGAELTTTAVEAIVEAMFAGRRTVTASATLTLEDYAVIADTEDDIILALPAAASRSMPYLIKNLNTGLVTINPDGVETINGAATLEIAEGDSRTVVPVAGGWETF